MPTIKYFVFDDNKCVAESMTKEQIYNAIAEATGATPRSVDDAFISTILETNHNRSLHIWKGSQAEFNALESHDTNTLYIINDDTTLADLQSTMDELESAINSIVSDTGWINLTATNLSSETESVGRYRVKNGIAYFDISFAPSHFTSGTYVQFRLPINLDIDTSKKPAFALCSGDLSQTAEFIRCYAQFSAGVGGGTDLHIDVASTSALARGNFCYPVAPNN